MQMPKPDDATKELFAAVLPPDQRVTTRPMFGQMSAFVNGNMFAGIFGDGMFVRLCEPERSELLREPGASVFEPMPGRPMRDYVMLPAPWREQPQRIRDWMGRSLKSAEALPAKKPKTRKR